MIRRAIDPKVLEEMWADLLEIKIPLSDRTRSIRNYVYNYVSTKKKKWSTAYFEDYLFVVLLIPKYLKVGMLYSNNMETQ